MNSKHYATDRQKREEIIQKIGYGVKVDSFIIDRGHRNGAEIHVITSTGIINIYNQRSHKLITKLIARPAQIKRYYTDRPAPQNLLEIALQNVKNHYNEF